MWENFALSETADVSRISIVAVKGPDGADADYPTLRASDCKAVGVLNTSRSNWVRVQKARNTMRGNTTYFPFFLL